MEKYNTRKHLREKERARKEERRKQLKWVRKGSVRIKKRHVARFGHWSIQRFPSLWTWGDKMRQLRHISGWSPVFLYLLKDLHEFLDFCTTGQACNFSLLQLAVVICQDLQGKPYFLDWGYMPFYCCLFSYVCESWSPFHDHQMDFKTLEKTWLY